MPTNLLNADTGFPNLNRYNSSDAKIKAITDYLYMLLEQLRYQFGNMSVDNFSADSLKELAKVITDPVYIQLEGEIGQINNLVIGPDGLFERLYDPTTGDITVMTATIDGLTWTDGGGTTYINGAMIKTDSVVTDKIHLSGALDVFTPADDPDDPDAHGGYLGFVTGSTGESITKGIGFMNASNTGQVIATNSGARMSYNNVSDVVVSGSASLGTVSLKAYDGTYKLEVQYRSFTENGVDYMSFAPYSTTQTGVTNPVIYLGTPNRPWATAYVDSAVVVTSDRSRKHDIEYGLDDYDSFFDELRPCRFRMNSEGNEGSYHVGLIAQDVEEGLYDTGLSDSDFAGLRTGAFFGLAYEEFIAMLIDQVQKLKARVTALEAET